MIERIPPDYLAIKKRESFKNINNVLTELNNGDKGLEKRIDTFVESSGFSHSEVEHKIRTDEMVKALFAKQTTRQTIYKKSALDWLSNELPVTVNDLKISKSETLYVSNNGRIDNYNSSSSIALDFHWNYNGNDFYAKHVYSNESGGTQMAAYRKVQDILRYFMDARDVTKILIVIADGDFYNKKRMQELKNHLRVSPPKSFAVHIQEVPDVVLNLGR